MENRILESGTEKLKYTPLMVLLYFILTFTITWAFLIPSVSIVPENSQTLFFIGGAFGPFISAIIIIWISNGKKNLGLWLKCIFRFRIPVVLYLAGAIMIPVLMGVLHYAIYRILGGQPDFSNANPWFLYFLYLIPTALLTGGNEEPGWRGFAYPALLQWFHPVIASVILGVLHGLWHLPLMNHYDTSIGWYLFNIIPLTFILNWFYLKSRYSIIPVMLLHAGTNVIGSFIPTPMDVLNGLGTYMFIRGLVYWGMAIVILLTTKGRLGYFKNNLNDTTR
jgi:membrane protease YdiL (CAAX protease family)